MGTPLHELKWQTRGNHQLIEHLQPGCLLLLELTLASPYPLIVAPTDVVAVAVARLRSPAVSDGLAAPSEVSGGCGRRKSHPSRSWDQSVLVNETKDGVMAS